MAGPPGGLIWDPNDVLTPLLEGDFVSGRISYNDDASEVIGSFETDNVIGAFGATRQ